MKKLLLINSCWIAIGFMPVVYADNTSSIRYEQGRYEDDANSYYLDVDLSLDSKNHLQFGYGKNTTEVAGDTLNYDLFYIGLQSDPYADMATGLTYTSIKDENNFDIASVRLDLILNTDDWEFIVSPELRNVDVYTTTGGTFNTLSPALGLGASYYGIDDVFISFGHTLYSYDKDISSSSGRNFSGMGMFSIPSTTLDQAYGLEDYRNRFSAGYNYGAGMIGLKHTRIVAIYDAAVTTINSVFISYNITDAWRAELSTGNVDDSVADTGFVSAALGYYW